MVQWYSKLQSRCGGICPVRVQLHNDSRLMHFLVFKFCSVVLCCLIGQPSKDSNSVDWLPTLNLAPLIKTDHGVYHWFVFLDNSCTVHTCWCHSVLSYFTCWFRTGHEGSIIHCASGAATHLRAQVCLKRHL